LSNFFKNAKIILNNFLIFMIYDLIIIGGGPAGMTAGIYAKRQKLNTLLITKNFGGQLNRKTIAIENYPGFEEISGKELTKKFEKHLRRQKIDIERDEVIKLKKLKKGFLVLTKSKNKFYSKAVIVASGADPRPLEVSGEKEFIGKGVSYCPLCDGPFYEGKKVAVIGGGNSGLETAIFLANYAKEIFILEEEKEVRADKINQERVKKIKKIKIITSAQLKEIQGQNFVNSIIYQDKKTKKEIKLPVEGVFVEIGLQPATSFVKNLVDFNEKDEIVVDPKTGQTKIEGLFAAGDIDNVPYKQIVIAAGEGAKAALSAYQYLEKLKKQSNAK
jgi:thioredoxin-disulfide reductase